MTALGGAVATMVTSSVAPAGRLARPQVTVRPATVQVQFGPLADTTVQPTGSVSVTDALTAAAGPPLRAWIRKVTLLPAVAGSPEVTVFCRIDTSAPGTTPVVAVAVLLLVSGSAVPPTAGATLATLVMLPPEAATVPVMLSGGSVAPTACRPACVQETVLPAPAPALVQFQPLPPADA